jgi:hypothetical protein
MIPPTSIDGTDITGATIDGTDVQEITVDGDVVFSAGPGTPASVVEQYDAQSAFGPSDDNNLVTSWTGEKQSITASGNGATVRSNGINGYRSLEFDGTDDFFAVSDAIWPDTEQPYTIIAVVELFSTGSFYQVTSGDQPDDEPGQLGWTGSDWIAFSGSAIFGSTDSTVSLLTGVFDGSNGKLREDGTQTASGSIGGFDLDSFAIGDLGGSKNLRNWEGYIGFVEVHDGLPTNGLSAREQEVADYWDITI